MSTNNGPRDCFLTRINLGLTRINFWRWGIFGVLGTISLILLILLAVGSYSYCSSNSEMKECLQLAGPIFLPNNAPSEYVASFIGTFFTFTLFYLLELIKEEIAPKPKLELSFNHNGDEKDQLIVDSNPHYIFVPTTQDHIEFGRAVYLRVKVTNKGNKNAFGCRAYLKTIEVIEGEKKIEKKTKLKNFDGPMRLLWPYEQKTDYRSHSAEQIPSLASEYIDVLVACDNALKPKFLGKDFQQKNVRFLKLKTQPQPLKHASLLKINYNQNITYALTIEVYADGSKPDTIILCLEYEASEHPEGEKRISVSSKTSSGNLGKKTNFPLYESMKPEDAEIAINYSKDRGISLDRLYDLL